jgi:hypothetical protein
MNRIRYQRTQNRSKHNTKGCWMFPNGHIFKNPTILDKKKKAELIKMLKDKGAEFFSSTFEAELYLKRQWEQKAGEISGLERTKKIELLSKDQILVCTFKTDFTYHRRGKYVIEDAKGSEFQCTPDWKLKWKWAQIQHPEWVFLITYQKQPKKSR